MGRRLHAVLSLARLHPPPESATGGGVEARTQSGGSMEGGGTPERAWERVATMIMSSERSLQGGHAVKVFRNYF